MKTSILTKGSNEIDGGQSKVGRRVNCPQNLVMVHIFFLQDLESNAPENVGPFQYM